MKSFSLKNLSSNKASFDQATPPYQKALDESGYNYTLTYKLRTPNRQRKRQRDNILWYNPPFSKNVSTNIGHKFLNLVDKHFPKDNKLRKILNRNTIKISYSCMNNTKQIIDSHTKRILKSSQCIDQTKTTPTTSKNCNCRQKNACPLNRHYLQTSVIYQASVTRKDNNTTETYTGLTENEFKVRYRNLHATFRHSKDRNSTELSKYVWSLKDNNIEHPISWQILLSHHLLDHKPITIATAQTHFLFNGRVYDQVGGVAMGSPIAPVLANLFLEHYEHLWLNKYKGPPIHFYGRYVDDTFCLFNNEHEALLFFEFLNSQHDSIKFTMEKENNNSLAFLDVLINNKDPTNLITSVYRKKTFTGLLTNFFSFTSFSYKLHRSYQNATRQGLQN